MTSHLHTHTLRNTLATLATGSVLLVGGAYGADSAVASPETAVRIAQAEVIPASSIQQQTLYLNNDRAYSYNLEVEQGVTVNGRYLPPGAEIQGQYVPAEGGLRYEANAVIIDGRSYPLNATSGVLTDIKDPRDTDTGAIAEDAGIGAAGGLVLGEVLGDADLAEILGGAAAGAAVGNVTADRVVVVKPNDPINLYP
ncbi:hypothetical protein XM38_014880 [Halomicronema hongdechloris C2206]|uniref:Uncharacterized protein n=1 Tax=Halomicronema hongdechloris C2206 TaxID=1641165 RepID=A0A1Z3HJR9_9CYAN|nr:hypothetical protein [Halomicronema hongdechloris]ASC70548.1 hypothetical protein XM38_014880 [Halomicronema hongdechloris C2206]